MAWTRVGVATTSSLSGSAPAVTHGLTILADDLVCASIHMNNTGVTSSPPSDAGGAWAQLGGGDGSFTNSYAVHWKAANGSEPATYNWTLSSSTRYSVVLEVWRGGAAPEADVVPTGSGSESGSSSTECPSIVVSAEAIVFGWHLQDAATSSNVTSVDNGFTLGGAEDQQTQDIAYKYVAAAGATGETKITSSITQDHEGYSWSFKEAAGGSSGRIIGGIVGQGGLAGSGGIAGEGGGIAG